LACDPAAESRLSSLSSFIHVINVA
jgi:hypothetical protein